jgi:hypothetical protein
MSQTRFRQIARLQNAARPYIGMRNRMEHEWQMTRDGAAGHAAILAFLIRYGDPKIGEPLSCAWQRLQNTEVWREYCSRWDEMKIARRGDESKGYGESTQYIRRSFMSEICRDCSPFTREGALLIGKGLRHELLKRFSGNNEKKKLALVFASAPPWLIWFTFGDYTAKLLGLPMPDLATVRHFARSKEDFENWYGLPRGAFESRPWPNGPENEQLAYTNLDLLRPGREKANHQMTRRESRRAKAAEKDLAESTDEWPSLIPAEYLAMPFGDLVKLDRDHRAGRT